MRNNKKPAAAGIEASPLVVFLAVLFAQVSPLGCTCESNEQGHLSAPSGGDLSHAPAPREGFDSEIARACGSLGVSTNPGESLGRSPYLQLVGESQATVVWTSSESGWQVTLQGPDGSDAQSVGSIADGSAAPDRGQQYLASIGNLSPGTLYCYQLRAGPGPDAALVYRGGFRTAPEVDATIRFSALGDLGKGSSDQLAVLEQLKTVRSDLLLITGDIAYENGTLAQYEAYFFGVYHEILALVPVFPASGNHDYQTRDAAAFREVFVLPKNASEDEDSAGIERWYSFDWGPVHFVVLDTETMLEEQALWLERDLAAASRSWTVVVLHKPPYSSGTHGSEASVRNTLVPVFREKRVDLVLAGHDHDYERTQVIDGVTYVVTGGAGRGTRPMDPSSFTAFAARVAHFVHVVADANTLTLHAIDATGQEFDSLEFTR